MKSEFNILVEKLYAGNIGKKEFLKEYFKGEEPNENYVLFLIDKAILRKDDALVQEAIVLLNTGIFKIDYFQTLLCQLLNKEWHTKHEDIVMLLKVIKSPKIIDCLYNATELQFAYLDYDDTNQFARKCIKVLSSIDNEMAIEKLKLLTNSKYPIIAEYARKELRNKKLL